MTYDYIELLDDQRVELEYKYNNHIFDIAILENNNIIHVIEVLSTHKTQSRNDISSWFEIKANDIIEIIVKGWFNIINNMDKVQFLYYNNSKSRKFVRKQFAHGDYINHADAIKQWLSEGYVKCYTICENGTFICVALLSKMDRDPRGVYNKPYTLNYIFTKEDSRKKGYALKMVKYLQGKEEICTFPENQTSVNLFDKAGYVNYGQVSDVLSIPLYRYP